MQLYRTSTFQAIITARIPFLSIENGKFAVTNPIISHKPLHARRFQGPPRLHVTQIWLQIWQVQAILNFFTQSLSLFCYIPWVLLNAKIQYFQSYLLVSTVFELSLVIYFSAWSTKVLKIQVLIEIVVSWIPGSISEFKNRLILLIFFLTSNCTDEFR